MPVEQMSKEEFHLWKHDPRTQEVMARLEGMKQEWVTRLVQGGTLCGNGPTQEETARAVGVIYGIDLILKAEWEE